MSVKDSNWYFNSSATWYVQILLKFLFLEKVEF